MRKVALLIGILAGIALAFVLSGGLETARNVGKALNTPAPTVEEMIAAAQ